MTWCEAGSSVSAPWRITDSLRPDWRRISAHARPQFVEIEGLDEIVVRTGVKSLDTVRDGVTCGDDQHRQRMAARTQRAQHIDTVAFWQPQVKQHQVIEVIGCAADGSQRRFAILDPVHRETNGLERLAHALGNHLVVFDQQDTHRANPGCRKFDAAHCSPSQDVFRHLVDNAWTHSRVKRNKVTQTLGRIISQSGYRQHNYKTAKYLSANERFYIEK